jgi:hypothetical protein
MTSAVGSRVGGLAEALSRGRSSPWSTEVRLGAAANAAMPVLLPQSLQTPLPLPPQPKPVRPRPVRTWIEPQEEPEAGRSLTSR